MPSCRVVKLASDSLVQKEWHAYDQNIRRRLLGIAQIRGALVPLPGSEWGGLCYPLLGAGTFRAASLRKCLSDPTITVGDVQFTLKRLLNVIELLARLSSPDAEARKASYAFPPHFVDGPSSFASGHNKFLKPSATTLNGAAGC
jgi:hypothetical protein